MRTNVNVNVNIKDSNKIEVLNGIIKGLRGEIESRKKDYKDMRNDFLIEKGRADILHSNNKKLCNRLTSTETEKNNTNSTNAYLVHCVSELTYENEQLRIMLDPDENINKAVFERLHEWTDEPFNGDPETDEMNFAREVVQLVKKGLLENEKKDSQPQN